MDATRMLPLGALLFASLAARPASADFLSPTGWTRQAERSTWQEWEVFTNVAGDPPNVPDVGVFNPNSPANGVPNVLDTSGMSFLTGGGNIYSFSAPTDIDVVVPNYNLGDDYHTTIILQTRTQGSEVDYAMARVGVVAPAFREELFRGQVGGPFGGEVVDSFYRWELSGNAATYLIEFPASESSMSLDRVAVDTNVSLAGDANGDGAVDIFDVNTVSDHWGTAGPTGDVNFDGTVDIFDVNTISDKWGNAVPVGVNAVPEPAAMVLAAVALAVIAAARRLAFRYPGAPA